MSKAKAFFWGRFGLASPVAAFSLVPHRHPAEPNSSRLTSLKSTRFEPRPGP
jgi:hypothetical protein